jgi:hypothetical protein
VTFLGFTLIGIITLEQTVHAFSSRALYTMIHPGYQINLNNLPDENSWGFGQIVALVLLIGPLSEFYDAIFQKSTARDDGQVIDNEAQSPSSPPDPKV